jgi:hypothetical protein
MEVVCYSQSFFSRHESEGFVDWIVLLFNMTKTLSSEHSSPMIIWENSVSTDILKWLVAETFTFMVYENVCIAFQFLFDSSRLSLRYWNILVFW